MEQFHNALHLIGAKQPDNPVFCLRPFAAARAARWFTRRFPGRVFYAVKANPAPWLLDALAANGVTHFDVASLAEARLIHGRFPGAVMGFMNPVKSAAAIAEAYHGLGIRIFALDSESELDKIIAATGGAGDLTLCVRMKVPGEHATLSLANKFGVDPFNAPPLLQKVRQHADSLGICFHVGSQAMSPAAYAAALDHVQHAIAEAGVIVDVIDVGGGFPAAYPGMTPPPMALFVDEIAARFEQMLITHDAELWCEPGRALAAEAASLLVRVESRKGNFLHINDGIYGALYDAGALGWTYPVRCPGREAAEMLAPFSFYGPTCDDADMMRGPFMLPADIGEGDYIEIGMLGAYGAAMRSGFNGFDNHMDVLVQDDVDITMFAETPTLPQIDVPQPIEARIIAMPQQGEQL